MKLSVESVVELLKEKPTNLNLIFTLIFNDDEFRNIINLDLKFFVVILLATILWQKTSNYHKTGYFIRKIPKWAKFMQDLRCPLTHDFKPCFLEKGNAAIPLLAKGVPDYNIPKMDPAEIQHVQLVSSPSLSLNLTNLKVYGLEKLRIIDIEVDLKRRMFRTTLSGENITVVGEYSVNGRILVLPIVSHGVFSVFLKNGIYIATKIDYIVERNGEKYYNPVFDPMDYHLEKVVFHIEDLFGGNKELGEEVNKFLNNNWDLLMIEFGPEIARIISKIITDIFDNLAAVVPVKYVFLDDPVFKFRK